MRDFKTVVVVNDDPMVLGLISEILSEEGYRVIACDQVDRAQATIQQAMPDLAILDVRMRGGADWVVVDRVKADTATVPVLVCSAIAPAEADARLRADGCNFLAMPFDVEELLAKVELLTSPSIMLDLDVSPAPVEPA